MYFKSQTAFPSLYEAPVRPSIRGTRDSQRLSTTSRTELHSGSAGQSNHDGIQDDTSQNGSPDIGTTDVLEKHHSKSSISSLSRLPDPGIMAGIRDRLEHRSSEVRNQ